MTASSAGMPRSSTSPVTTPYWGSSPVVNLAMRTRPSLPAEASRTGIYPRGCGIPACRTSRRARRGVVDGASGRARAAGRHLGAAAPGPPPGRGRRTRSRTSSSPTTPSARPRCGAGTRASASRCRAARPRATCRSRATAHVAGRARRGGPAGRRGHRGARRRPAAADRGAAPTADRDGRPAGPARLLRDARVGDGLPPRAGRRPARLLAAAAGQPGHRRGGGVAPDRVLALRRVPVLHRRRPAAQRPAARARRPRRVRAAWLPARRDGPLQARVPADPDGAARSWSRTASSSPATSGCSTCGRRRTTSRTSATPPCASRRPRASRSTPRRSARSPSAGRPCAARLIDEPSGCSPFSPRRGRGRTGDRPGPA